MEEFAWMDRMGWWGFGWYALLRPGPSPQPSPVQRERGMFVADECTPMMGVWLFGWQGGFETCPYVWRIASMERVGCCGGGVVRPRAYPALLSVLWASLARAPLPFGHFPRWHVGNPRFCNGLLRGRGLEPAPDLIRG